MDILYHTSVEADETMQLPPKFQIYLYPWNTKRYYAPLTVACLPISALFCCQQQSSEMGMLLGFLLAVLQCSLDTVGSPLILPPLWLKCPAEAVGSCPGCGWELQGDTGDCSMVVISSPQ